MACARSERWPGVLRAAAVGALRLLLRLRLQLLLLWLRRRRARLAAAQRWAGWGIVDDAIRRR